MFGISSRLLAATLPLLLSVARVAAEDSGAPRSGSDRESAHDIAVTPHGAVADAGWALARLNDADAMGNQSFAYPETTQPVRLFLIDSAVAHLGTWFAQNPNLTLEHSAVIGGTTSTDTKHGTEMLSLIAGPGTGAAVGTPIQLVSIDVYQGGTSTLSRITEAIYEALEYHEDHPGVPGVICIASGSEPVSSAPPSLTTAINKALAMDLTVIVSAGNVGANASQFLPSALGTQSGVVCVGASDANNVRLPNSNHGVAVDLYAPGFEVRCINHGNPFSSTFGTMSGTSPATALTAAAAIIELSKNTNLEPADVEGALKGESVATVTPPPPQISSPAALIQVQPDPEGDSDGDGAPDILERFFGSNLADSSILPSPATVTRIPGHAQFSFVVAADLYNNGSGTLSDGSTWRIRCSENLTDWTDAIGTLSPGAAVDGKIPVTFSMPTTAPACFLRIEVTPAP